MKVRTDPKTMKTTIVLASADNAAICKTIDVLLNAAHCDGEKDAPYVAIAAELKTFVQDHQPKKKPMPLFKDEDIDSHR